MSIKIQTEMNTGRHNRLQKYEHWIYFACLIPLLVSYLVFSFLFPSPIQGENFGFSQLRHLGFPPLCFVLIFTWYVLNRIAVTKPAFWLRSEYSRLIYLSVAVLFFTVFLGFRNEFLNPDAVSFAYKFVDRA